MSATWHTRNYQPGDEEGILALWRESFPEGEQRRTELDYWRWQYLEGPSGPGLIRLAVSENRIVGHAAAIPFQFMSKGKEVLGCLSLDSMTAAGFRGQGMFTRLEEELYDDLARSGVQFIYGFPNDNSIGVFLRKLDWKQLATLPLRARPIRLDRIAKTSAPLSFLGPVLEQAAKLPQRFLWPTPQIPSEKRDHLVWLDEFDARAERLWRPLQEKNAIFLRRDEAFLNWRYADNPGREYPILGYEEGEDLQGLIVLRRMEAFGLQGGMILELQALPGREDLIPILLDAAVEHFAREEMDLALCLTPRGSSLERPLRSKRFLAVPERLGHKKWYFGGRGLPYSGEVAMLEPIASWYLTLGDTDII